MAKSVSQSMNDLRDEVAKSRELIARIIAKSADDGASARQEAIDVITRWIADAEKVLARWEREASPDQSQFE